MNATPPAHEFWKARLGVPNYEVGEAARYAEVHANTVWRWHRNTTLGPREAGSKLSYLELIELAFVASCKAAGMKLADIRAARAYFAGKFDTEYPFATLDLMTDGVDLAMKAGADLLIGNRGGQLAWKRIIGARFEQFEYEDGIAARWRVAGKRSPVMIDPRIRFGAPQVEGIPTWLLKERWSRGEPVEEIASDLSLGKRAIFAALRFEGLDPTERRKNEWLH